MKKSILLLYLSNLSIFAFSQNTDSTRIRVTGAVTVTNNGISLVPTFSLGKPATVFDVAIRKNRFSFEPQLAFALEDAKPWFFAFWLRYKLIQKSKFTMGAGFHPGFVFSTNTLTNNGITKEYIDAARFFVGELTPTYSLSKNISIGLYYLNSRGFNSDLKQLNFLGFNTNFSNIKLGNKYFVKVMPQVYYLKTDERDGLYFSTSTTLVKRNFPLSVSSIINKKIKSSIASDDFVWNLSLIYSY